MIPADVLAAFTHFRRRHYELSPVSLDRALDVPNGSTRAVESKREVRPETREKFVIWNGLEGEA
ncbi:MAG: hypothetical protein KDJ69_16925 [Nitratireductor sp.]|nr:hypothetical protein [Nitratireductor sp.]